MQQPRDGAVVTLDNIDVLKERVVANPDDVEAVQSLRGLLANPDGHVRSNAAATISQLRARVGGEVIGHAVLRELIALLNDDDEYVVRSAAAAIGSFGADAADAVPQLERLLREELEWGNTHTGWTIVSTLGQIGPAAAPATQTLVKALHVPPRELRPGDGDAGTEVRELAAEALAEIGPAAAGAIQPLRAMVEHSEGKVRILCAGALAQIDPNDDVGVPVLVAEASAGETGKRGRALDQLWRARHLHSKAVRQCLESLQNDADPEVRNWARQLMKRLAATQPR